MKKYECWEIAGHSVEYLDETHNYLVDGVCVASVTQLLKKRFGGKYDCVSPELLKAAADKGTEMHLAIQNFEEQGTESELKELRNYKFLKGQYKWNCIECETPVILFDNDEPIACGRVDMIADLDGHTAIFDFKRTYTLDKEYVGYQLNLYRIAYRQTYGIDADILRAVHLREDLRKFVAIPVNEEMAWKLIREE